jgi:hypothetical protein
LIALNTSGCDYDPSAINAKLNKLDSRVTQLEHAPPPAPPIPQAPPIPTVLWVQNPNAYPRASAYFHAKDECAEAAALWGFPDDKGAKQVGTDPWTTISSKKDQYGQPGTLVVSCLPQGVTPYASK